MVVYVDVLFAINLLADWLTLESAAQVGGFGKGRGRMAAGAFLGAAYGVLAVVGPNWLSGGLVKLLWGTAMTAAALGWPNLRGGLQRLLATWVCSGIFGGAMLFWQAVFRWEMPRTAAAGVLVMEQGFWATAAELVLTRLLFSLVAQQVKREKIREEGIHMVKIVRGDRTCILKGLVDTGNSLRDGKTGYPVAVTGYPSVKGLFSEEERQALQVLLGMKYGNFTGEDDFRLVSYTTVNRQGLMPVFQPDGFYVERDGVYEQVEQVVIGVGQQQVSCDGGYDMLLQLQLLTEKGKGDRRDEQNVSCP